MAFRYPKKSFGLELKGFETMSDMFKRGGYEKILRMKLRHTNKKLAQLGAARLSQEIRAGQFEANSPMTAWLKKSTKPLIDHGDLVGSISGKVTSGWYSFVVGVKRRTPSGKNLAHMLETGFTIKVTPAMRKLFWYWSTKSGGRFKALKQSTTAIRVKPRPYMKQAFFDDNAFIEVVKMAWGKAVKDTFAHFAKKAKAEPWR